MSQPGPDFARQILEAFDLPTDPAFVRLITTPDPALLRERRYREALPGRMREVAGVVSERYAGILPDGVRVEWTAR